MGVFRNLRIEPFDILGKMRHAKMVSTRTHLVPKTSSAAQQLVSIAHDFELLVNIFEPTCPIQMILFATVAQLRPWRDQRCNVAHLEQTPKSRRVITAAIAVEMQQRVINAI